MAAEHQPARRTRNAPGGAPGRRGVRVVLDNVRSAFNVGSVFRTCEAAGAAHLYLCGITAAPPNPRVSKTALGAEGWLPWSHHISTRAVIEQLRAAGVMIVAVEVTPRSTPYTALAYPPEVAFLFGHEVAGVAAPLVRQADAVVAIPMRGRKNSLNVATSVGIVLFEFLRQEARAEQETKAPGPENRS